MTLGVSYALNQRLVVLGDLLLSGNEREHDVCIPSVGDVTEVFPKGSGYSIIGLTQKVIVICDDLAIAWAGHEIAATMVIRELRDLAVTGLTPQSLSAFLQQLPEDLKGLDLQLTGFFVYEKEPYLIDFKADAVDTPHCSYLQVIGTGAPVFEKMLAQCQLEMGARRGVDAERGDFLVTTMAFAGLLLELELKSKTTSLHSYFGGGYEVVLGEAGAFRKLDDVTHVYWNVQVSADGVGISKPFHIQKQFYRDRNLMIMPVRFPAQDSDQQAITCNELYVVQEPGGVWDAQEINTDDLPSYNSRSTCHFFIQGETAQVFTRYQYREDPQDNDLRIIETAKGMRLEIRKSFFETIASTLQKDPRWQLSV
ncbi:hypothetical protein [Pseudomonas sp. WC2]|uniref:hypothetical protein n=1 Tax=Pseudomonas sp. WC2 TaxID=3424773 RepID=UPI003D34B6C4